MRPYDVHALTAILLDLADNLEWCSRRRVLDSAEEKLKKEDWLRIFQQFRDLEDAASAAEFPMAFEKVTALNSRLDTDEPPNFYQLEADIRHVREMFLADMERACFVNVAPSHRTYLDNENLFGSAVSVAFPSATRDLRDAGNCFAAGCNTAAVFHLMRAVEWALRGLGVHLGFRQLRATKKSGKRKHVPISHLEWEKIIDQLQVRVDRRVERMRPGKRKQSVQEFYYPILQEIRAIRDAWRNHVMHGRSEYSAEDAATVMTHVRRLMTKLAGRVSEV